MLSDRNQCKPYTDMVYILLIKLYYISNKVNINFLDQNQPDYITNKVNLPKDTGSPARLQEENPIFVSFKQFLLFNIE